MTDLLPLPFNELEDYSDLLTRIRILHTEIPPHQKARVHLWCQRCIERDGGLDALEAFRSRYPPGGDWYCIRQCLPVEAMPTLEKHLLSVIHEEKKNRALQG